MRFDCAVVQYMCDSEIPGGKHARDQQTTVAIERFALGAHQADAAAAAAPRRVGDEALDAGLEFALPRHSLVVGNALAIQIGTSRTATEWSAVR